MKHFFYFLIATFSVISINAQHACSIHKIKQFNKTYAKKTSGVAVVAPLENKYDLKFYHLNLNVERNSAFISGNVMSRAKVVVASLDSFAFVLHQNHTIDSVYVNGAKRIFVRQDSLVKATTGTPILLNTIFDAIVYYKGTCPSSGGAAIGNGYTAATSGSWGNEVTFSLSESLVAYEWFPCKQDLTDKIDSSWVFATTDSANMVGSNGLLKNVVSLGLKKRYEWKSRYPIDYYLISVSTAKYRQYNFYAKPQYLAPDSIFIQNFIYDNAIYNPAWNTQKTALNKMKQTIELQCKLFGMYPFFKEKYGHCMAPLGGGMEHQTMTTLGFFEFELDAHELGHQWWGDNVTCKSWKDIFVNEGWASYSEYLSDQYLPAISGVSAATNMTNAHNNVMSQAGGSCFFTNADTVNASRIFDSRLTYDKGSALIHMLRYTINNDSTFFNAIRGFQNTYKFNVASVIDFKNYMQTFTSINLTQFFNQWFYGEGYPTFDVKYNQVGTNLLLQSNQTQSFPSSVPLFITDVDYKISRVAKADTVIRLNHGVATENYTIALTGSVTSVFVDPANWILNKVIGPTKDVNLGTILGVEEQSMATIFVGPNPTSDFINIYLYQTEKAFIEITDLTGKLITSQAIKTEAQIDISKYSNGIYNVTIKNAQNQILKTTKLVKN